MALQEIGERRPDLKTSLVHVEGVKEPIKVEQLATNVHRVDLNPFLEREIGPDWDQEFLKVARRGKWKPFRGGEAPTSLVGRNFVTNYRITQGEQIASSLPQAVELARGPLLKLTEIVLGEKLRPAGDSRHWINLNYHRRDRIEEKVEYEPHLDRNFGTQLVAITTLKEEQGGVTQFWKPTAVTNCPQPEEVEGSLTSEIASGIRYWEKLPIVERISVLRESGVFESRMRDRSNLLHEASPQKGFAIIFRGDIIAHSVTELQMINGQPTERLTFPIDYDPLLKRTNMEHLWGNPQFDQVLLGENGHGK